MTEEFERDEFLLDDPETEDTDLDALEEEEEEEVEDPVDEEEEML